MFKKEGVGVKSIKCQQNEIEIMHLSGSALALHSFQKDFFFFFFEHLLQDRYFGFYSE